MSGNYGGSNLQIAALSHVWFVGSSIASTVQFTWAIKIFAKRSQQQWENNSKTVCRFGPMNVDTRTQKMMKSTALREPLMSPDVIRRMWTLVHRKWCFHISMYEFCYHFAIILLSWVQSCLCNKYNKWYFAVCTTASHYLLVISYWVKRNSPTCLGQYHVIILASSIPHVTKVMLEWFFRL